MARILGLHIDRDALRGVLLKTAFRSSELGDFITVPLAVAPGSPGRLAEVREALQNMLSTLGKPPDIVHSSLDGDQASLRVVDLPLAAAKRAADVLPFELESMLPFEVSDAVVDYQPIGTHDGELKLLAAAALKTRVREHLQVFNGSPLEPRELGVGAAALDGLRALVPELKTGHQVVLALSGHETDFCVLQDGRVTFARTLSSGTDDKPSTELHAAIRRTLAAYRATGADVPEHVFIGGEDASSEFAEEIGRQSGIATSLLPLPEVEEQAGPLPLAFTRAAALAGRALTTGKRINLRTGEFASERHRGDLTSQLQLLTLCALGVLLCGVFALKAQKSVLQDENDVLTKQLGDVTEQVFGKRETSATRVEALLKSPPNDSPLPRFDAYDALAAISDAIDTSPSKIEHEVRHMRIDLAEDKKEGKMELQGLLASIEQRDVIVMQLEGNECFRDITRGRTSPNRGGEQISYQIEAKLQCPGEATTPKKKKSQSE